MNLTDRSLFLSIVHLDSHTREKKKGLNDPHAIPLPRPLKNSAKSNLINIIERPLLLYLLVHLNFFPLIKYDLFKDSICSWNKKKKKKP